MALLELQHSVLAKRHVLWQLSGSGAVQGVRLQQLPTMANHDQPVLGTRLYQNIHSSDQARVHLGDVYGT